MLIWYFGLITFLCSKDRFRSIYAALDKESRKKLRSTKNNIKILKENTEKVPEVMLLHDAEIFLLYHLKDEINEKLNEKKKSTLKRFVKNFEKFQELSEGLSKKFEIPEELLYAYYYKPMARKREQRIIAEYRFDVEKLKERIKDAYKKLKEELDRLNAVVVDVKSDYLFLKASEEIEKEIEKSKHFYFIKKFSSYAVD